MPIGRYNRHLTELDIRGNSVVWGVVRIPRMEHAGPVFRARYVYLSGLNGYSWVQVSALHTWRLHHAHRADHAHPASAHVRVLFDDQHIVGATLEAVRPCTAWYGGFQ